MLRIRSCAAGAIALALVVALAPVQAQSPAQLHQGGLQSATGHDGFIVKYRGDVDSAARLRQALAAVAGPPAALASLRRMATGADAFRVDRTLDRDEAEALMRRLAADADVEYIEVDVSFQPDMIPDDPGYGTLWGLHAGPGGIDAEQAWDRTNGRGIVVAVLDSGITSHEDLDANVLPGYDFISAPVRARDGDGRDADATDMGDWMTAHQCALFRPFENTDSTWHGTHIAGTIAAVANNGRGVAGVAHGAKIVPVRVAGACGGILSDIADAVVWAAGGAVPGVPVNPHPAEVLNMSIGMRDACSATLQRAIDLAVGLGATIVASAGNNGIDASSQMPANCERVIAVGAVDEKGDWDMLTNHGAAVDVTAPGVEILSTFNAGTREATAGRTDLVAMSGTSMAAAHVSGVVALMQSNAARPYPPAQVEEVLKGSTRRHPRRPAERIGTGIVDAPAALRGGPPKAVDLAIVGTPQVGRPLTAQYRYTNPQGHSEGPTNFQWYRIKGGAQPIPGAIGRTYVPVAVDIGLQLSVVVVPRTIHGPSPDGPPSRGADARALTTGKVVQ